MNPEIKDYVEKNKVMELLELMLKIAIEIPLEFEKLKAKYDPAIVEYLEDIKMNIVGPK